MYSPSIALANPPYVTRSIPPPSMRLRSSTEPKSGNITSDSSSTRSGRPPSARWAACRVDRRVNVERNGLHVTIAVRHDRASRVGAAEEAPRAVATADRRIRLRRVEPRSKVGAAAEARGPVLVRIIVLRARDAFFAHEISAAGAVFDMPDPDETAAEADAR